MKLKSEKLQNPKKKVAFAAHLILQAPARKGVPFFPGPLPSAPLFFHPRLKMGNKHSGGGKSRKAARNLGARDINADYKFDDSTLGKGHFAIVKRAVNRTTGKECAVKIIKKKDMVREKVEQEVDILRQAGEHPAIVQLYDVYYDHKVGAGTRGTGGRELWLAMFVSVCVCVCTCPPRGRRGRFCTKFDGGRGYEPGLP